MSSHVINACRVYLKISLDHPVWHGHTDDQTEEHTDKHTTWSEMWVSQSFTSQEAVQKIWELKEMCMLCWEMTRCRKQFVKMSKWKCIYP